MKTYSIKKTAGMSINDIYKGVNDGGRFVIYGYCISIVAMTFRRISSPYYIEPYERLSKYRSKYNLLSLVFGWWGLPWGPIYTIDMININFKNGGGIDVTEDILIKLEQKYPEITDDIFDEDITIDYDDGELIR